MIRHDAAMTLAATALDFQLSPAERARLDEHLASCPDCARGARAVRADAGLLADLPPARLDPRRADAILARVLVPPAVGGASLRLVLVAAVLTLLALGSLAVGGELLRRANDKDLSVVPPQPAPSMQPAPSAPASPGPDGSPGPNATLAPLASIGVAWTPVTMPGWTVPDPGGATMNGVIPGGPGAIAWGWTYGLPAQVWTTADGMTWDPAKLAFPADADPEYEDPGTITSIARWGPGYVATGFYHRLDTGRRSLVWTSPDGRTWTPVPHDPVFEIGIMDNLVEWNGELLAFGHAPAGALGGGAGAQLWSSPDGVTWKAEDLRLPDGLTMSFAVAAVDHLWAYGATEGEDVAGEGAVDVLLTSTDGRTWTTSPLPRSHRQLVAPYGGPLGLLRPGFEGGDNPGIYQTDDLTTWQVISGDAAAVGYDIIDVGGLLVMVGDDSKTGTCGDGCHAMGWRSTDGGRTWQAVPADGPGGTMQHVAALPDGTMVAIGDRIANGSASPAAWVSVPAAAPVATPAPSAGPTTTSAPVTRSWESIGSIPVGEWTLADVVGFGGGYVAIERGSKAWFSADAMTWEPFELPSKAPTSKNGFPLDARVTAIASDGQEVVVVGGYYSNQACPEAEPSTGGGPGCPIVPQSWVSSDGRTWTKGQPVSGLVAPAGKTQGAEFMSVWPVPTGGWDAAVGWWEGESLTGRDILHSDDGLSWTPIASASASVADAVSDDPYRLEAVVDASGRRLLWAQWWGGGVPPVTTLALSADGTAWEAVDGFPGSAADITDALAPDPGGPWLLAGQDQLGEEGQGVPIVFASPDGRTWEAVPLPLGDMRAGRVERLVRQPDGYLAVGYRKDAADTMWLTAWHSTDGRSWALVDAPTEGALADGNRFATVGPAGTIAVVGWLVNQEPGSDVLRLR